MNEYDIRTDATIDRFLAREALNDSQKLSIREQISAASVAALAASDAAIAANAAAAASAASANADAISDVAEDVAANTAAIAAAGSAISATNAAVAALASEVADNASDLSDLAGEVSTNATNIAAIEATVEAAVTGVASVAGEVGIIFAEELLTALNVEAAADVTDVENVTAVLAAASEKEALADDDKFPTLDSENEGALVWSKMSTIVAKAKALYDTLYATAAQGVLAASAVQPNTAATLATLQLAPVAFSELPDADAAGAGAVANINDGSVAAIGSNAAGGGVIHQRVRSNGTVWLVDSGAASEGGEGGLDEEAVIALINDADPTTTAGDLIVRGASGLERFSLDADGKVLGTVAGALAWVTMTGGEGGGLTESEVNTLIDATLAELPASLTNPMEEAGDLIVGGVDGAPGRVAAGAEYRVLAVGSAGPAWLRRDHFYEREIYGENVSLDLSTHHHCFVVPTAGKIIWAEAESFVYTSNPSIALTVNGTPTGTYIYPASGNGVTALRAGWAHQSISVAGGDNVGVYIVDNGGYMSSTATGLRVGILFVPTDAS